MTNQGLAPIVNVSNLGISIAVKSLEDTSRWYQENLGFREVLRRDFLEYGTRIAFLESSGVRIELIEDQRWKPVFRPDPPQHTSIQGISQITFRVDGLEAIVERVKKRPITIAWDLIEVKDIGFKEFFIRDNEGNIIQFVETRFRYAGDPR